MIRDASREAVALFVREPVPGRVKTRLAQDIGDAEACALYRAMVGDTLGAVAACHLPLHLFHDGDESTRLPAAWDNAAHRVLPQRGDSLGERMAAAFEGLFGLGYERVALLGSDVPGLDAPLIAAAFQALQAHHGAIVPAVDGGYCLIALQRQGYRARLFQEIAWSTDTVLATTCRRFNESGLQVSLLDPRQDIDTLHDLEQYCRRPHATAIEANRWLREAQWLDRD